ncbi:MAG: glutamyl-tRNA reductase [Gemmatimonadetes bacterium]|nr:glutamyl-tRNA reductase [Gemmatimonadota bacterium]
MTDHAGNPVPPVDTHGSGLVLVGFNHRTAPIEVRERLAWPEREVPQVTTGLVASGGKGAVLLTTCNRTEFYLADPAPETLSEIWKRSEIRIGAPSDQYAYVLRDRDVARHLFRVASGLDSLVVGESQIQGQVREAWELSRHVAGPVLHRLFQSALGAGGRVRSETPIGTGSASVPTACVDLARKVFSDLVGRRALVLGTGEMAELAITCLVDEGVRPIVAAHRNMDRALQIVNRLGGQAIEMEEGWIHFGDVDLVICSTAAPHAIVTAERVGGAIRSRSGRPLLVLDIAVPRDVDPQVGTLENVFLYDIDDLQGVAAQTIGDRKRAIPVAERIVDEEVGYFWEWYASLGVTDSVRALRDRMEQTRRSELERALKRLGHLDPGDRERIEHLTRALMNKFLHEPTIRLRAAASNGHGTQLAETLRFLFDLGKPAGSEGGDDHE